MSLFLFFVFVLFFISAYICWKEFYFFFFFFTFYTRCKNFLWVNWFYSERLMSPLTRSFAQEPINMPISYTDLFICNIFNIYLFLRERDTHTESEAVSRFWAVNTETKAGLEPMSYETITWTEVKHLNDWSTQFPQEKSTF